MFTQFRYLYCDLRSWKCCGFRDSFYTFFEGGVWATIIYRINRSFFLIDIPIIKIPIRLFCFILFKLSEVLFGISLPPAVDIGPGLHIGHTGLIVINYQVKAGKNLSIGNGIIIGAAGLGKIGAPVVGNNVFIGSGAKILGKISVGNNSRIGANAVVISNVPEGATVVGVPAKVVKIQNLSDM